MKKNNRKQAYTLAEIMVVMLVLTIIFAAFSPLFTKRRLANLNSKYSVWDYADRVSLDAFNYVDDPTLHSQLFFGLSPETKEDIENAFLPLAKVVIRSGEVTTSKFPQRQIQFRYGRSGGASDHGDFAGTWFMNSANTLIGGDYLNLNTNVTEGAKYNTAIGSGALSRISNGSGNTAIGYAALYSTSSADNNVAIGYLAGTKVSTNANTLIGAYAGAGSIGSRNTLVGYYAGYNAGTQNTFLGAYAGYLASGNNNVALGYNALKQSTGEYNIALGTGALQNLKTGSNNVAIGYNACKNLVNSSNKTCIGANSGPRSNSTADKYLNVVGGTDNEIRTYIGSAPKYFGGDAVLEIHNLATVTPGMALSKNTGGSYSNTTTVINGNLIVKGRPYFTNGGNLVHFHDLNYMTTDTKETGFYGYGQNSSYYAVCNYSYSSYSMGNCVNLDTSSSTSDRRLKNIGSKSVAGLAEIKKLKVYNYTFKNDKDKLPHVGVIAQDLQKVFPNSVFEGSDGYLRIKWDEMFYATINAIKELDKKIVALVNRAAKVETQITKLEKENLVLKTQVDSLTARVNKLKAQ